MGIVGKRVASLRFCCCHNGLAERSFSGAGRYFSSDAALLGGLYFFGGVEPTGRRYQQMYKHQCCSVALFVIRSLGVSRDK